MNKYSKLIEEIEQLTAIELVELVEMLEERFGVKANMGIVPQQEAPKIEKEEEKQSFNIILKDAGTSRIAVIKAMREITGLGLKESKDVVDKAPIEIKTDISELEAKDIQQKLQDAGAIIEIK